MSGDISFTLTMICSSSTQPDPTLLTLYVISVTLVLVVGLVSGALNYFTEEPVLLLNEFLTVCMIILLWLTLLTASAKNLKATRY